LLLILSYPALAADMSGMTVAQNKHASPAARAEGTIKTINADHFTITLAHGYR